MRDSVDVGEYISQRELRNDSGRIMRALDEGTTFIVTRNGQPVGELRPQHRRRFVEAQTVIAMFQGAPGLNAHRLRPDLDAVTDQVAEPRA